VSSKVGDYILRKRKFLSRLLSRGLIWRDDCLIGSSSTTLFYATSSARKGGDLDAKSMKMRPPPAGVESLQGLSLLLFFPTFYFIAGRKLNFRLGWHAIPLTRWEILLFNNKSRFFPPLLFGLTFFGWLILSIFILFSKKIDKLYSFF